jgi:hypothetical protein
MLSKLKALIIVLLFSLSSCVTFNAEDNRLYRTPGQELNVSNKSFNQIWNATTRVIFYADAKILTRMRNSKNLSYLKAKTPDRHMSAGEVVGIFIEKNKNSPGYKIKISTRRRLSRSFLEKDWPKILMEKISNELRR